MRARRRLGVTAPGAALDECVAHPLPGPGRPVTPTYCRTLAPTLDDYRPVAQEVEAFCAASGLPAAARSRVRVVLEELVLNLIDHATGWAAGRIGVRIEAGSARVVVELEDDAAPFDPRSAPAFDPPRAPEERGPRGMGIHLVRSLAQAIEYERAGGRNRLRVAVAR
jgi:anti-sigma regulatory factor (Ser/Thr protein kinase)